MVAALITGTWTLASHSRFVPVNPRCSLRPCPSRVFGTRREVCRTRSTTTQKHRIQCSADDFEEGELLKGVKAGDKLKVKESRIVWHSPKHKEGLDLKGLEGTIIEVIEKYQGKQLSANLPYKTQFLLPLDSGKEQKLIAHLAAGEFDKV